MSKQIDNKEANSKPELYTLLCPVDLFRYFLRKNYKEVEMNNEECDEIGKGFYKYLQNLELTDEQKKNILPKDTFDVILNSEHPLRTNGFPSAYVFHFTEYVGNQNGA